jgi:hypothetical protein
VGGTPKANLDGGGKRVASPNSNAARLLEHCRLSLSLSAIGRVATVGNPNNHVFGGSAGIEIRDLVHIVAITVLESARRHDAIRRAADGGRDISPKTPEKTSSRDRRHQRPSCPVRWLLEAGAERHDQMDSPSSPTDRLQAVRTLGAAWGGAHLGRRTGDHGPSHPSRPVRRQTPGDDLGHAAQMLCRERLLERHCQNPIAVSCGYLWGYDWP